MSRKIIDIGVSGNDGTGDSIREAFRKTNNNFSELYAVFGQGGFLKFTDLSDTPDEYTNKANHIPIVNSIATGLTFKELVSSDGTIGIVYDDANDQINLTVSGTRVEDDPLPKLQNSLNASNTAIGGLRAPVSNSEFISAVNNFNTDHGTSYSIDSFAINKGYADNKYVNVTGDTMSGHLNVPAGAEGTEVPRASEVVLKTGASMTGDLYLNDHPGGAAGAGTPNGTDDLQAATKYYVDSASYSSQVNLFVTTSGDDSQARTPVGKEGRDRSYAYGSINKACQKAEELVNNAPWETGPYRQLIAYNGGEAYSEVTRVTTGVSGTTRIYFSNNGGNRVDQGDSGDIVSGKIVVGRNSGAKGFIYQYYGQDGSSPTGEDYFDLQDVEGEFQLGENLEFDQAVKDIQISIFVESGSYYEDYPIRIPPNTAIVGDELRRCLIRPADRPSRSPWVDVWFRRDTQFDGLDITPTEYGYHYLTDPSDPLSEPKNNRDCDVFLCNDAVIIRQITCQGHGGFMMVLDPEGQILTKSAYIQQSGSFSGSVNKQAFRGGQYVDGFAGNISMNIVEKLTDTEFLVTDAERAPNTPCSFVVDGQIYKVDAYTDDGTGYGGARQLIKRNIEFIKRETIGYIDTELSPEFTYNRTTCQRDIGLIVDALSYDLAIGTNFNGVRAGQAYYRGTQYDTLPEQVEQTQTALTYTREEMFNLLSGNTVAQTRVDEGMAEILDIIVNGVESSDDITFPTHSGIPTSVVNAKNLLLLNLDFLAEEGIGYIAENYPFFVYDEDKCRRDTKYIIEAVCYDLMYTGNSATTEAGHQYYDGAGNLQIPGQTLQTTEALAYISSVAQSVIQNVEIEFPKQSDVTQVYDLPNPSSSADADEINELMANINTIILGGRDSGDTIVYPDLIGIGVDSAFIDTRALFLNNKEALKSDTIVALDQRYLYNKTTCARDTGYIAEAIAHDIYYNGNLKSIYAAISYFNASASSKVVLDSQLQNTLDAIERIRTVVLAVAQNVSPATRYQQDVIQYINANFNDGAAAVTRINELFDLMLDVLTDIPVGARDAKDLLVANKEFIQAEVLNFIRNKYVNFTYDQAKCERDVGYVVDALSYDLLFGTNFQSIVAGRAYYRANSSVAVGVQLAATVDAYRKLKELAVASVTGEPAAVTSVSNNMDTIIDIVLGGLDAVPVPTIPDPSNLDIAIENSRDTIAANKNFVIAEVTRWILVNHPALVYDAAACERDVGYAIDAFYYDLTYSTNIQTIIAGRAYYEGSNYIASRANPRVIITTIVGSTITSQDPHDLEVNDTIVPSTSANGLTAGTTYYVVSVIDDSNFELSTAQGGAPDTFTDGAALDIETYAVSVEEKQVTLDAFTFMKSLLSDLSLNLVITPLQTAVTQVSGQPGNPTSQLAVTTLVDGFIDIVDQGITAAPGEIAPDQSTVSSGLINAKNSLQTDKAGIQSGVTLEINNNYRSGFEYNETICNRDVGFIIGNVSSDLLYGGTYLSIRSALRYHIGTASSRTVLNEQLQETVDSLEYASYVAQQVLQNQPPEINFQNSNGVEQPVEQVFDSVLAVNAATFAPRLAELMNLINGIIVDPDVDVTTIVADAEMIDYPTYRLIISDTTPVTNPLEFIITGFSSSVDSGVGDGSYDVTFTVADAAGDPIDPDPLIKTRYRIYGNSNTDFNIDSVECVASTSSTMTLRYPADPGSFGAGNTYIEYVKQFMLLSAGNTSMCSNDFTQINDVGYGLVATNLGLIETVSVFSYYCWAAYYANNGGQIRSLNGSNAHGEYGIVSEGSDPLEVPDSANLADNMMQVMKVFKQNIFSLSNAKDELAIYVYDYDYAPYNVAECEINHGSGVITDLEPIGNGGTGYTDGTYIDVPLTGGTGSDATANIVISGGAVVTVGLVLGGSRYSAGDVLSVNNTDVGGTGSGLSVAVDQVIGNGIARYEVASVTDVSSLMPETITGTPAVAGPDPVTGKYTVTYTFAAVDYGTPLLDVPYTVTGNSNDLYNGVYTATASTSTTVTLEYDNDPGTWGTGTSQIWGRGNVIRLNVNTGGNNDTAANGLATDLEHDQPIIVRLNQNFKFYEVDDTNPVRPSTALTFVGDPNPSEAIVYRVLAYGSKGPLNENLAEDEAILGFDTTYDYIKLLVSNVGTDYADTDNPGQTLGATVGDTKIAIERVNEEEVENRLNSGEMIIAWDGKIHKILSYVDLGIVLDYGIIEIEDVTDKCLAGRTATPGLYSPVDPNYNLDIAEPPTIRAGLQAVEPCEIIVRISTCRVTGHDFLDIGSGSYNQTNFPNKIYGAGQTPNQAYEVTERTRGRCFYVTTDQDGIFRVGRFFTVDQGTGRVTFAASIALSNLDGLGFKRGVTVSEFSNDDTFTDGANDALPTEAAVQGYIDFRLGMDRTNLELPASSLIGPGYMDRGGVMQFSGPNPMNLGGFKIINLKDPTSSSDASTKSYVDVQDLSNVRVDTTTSPAKAVDDLLVWNGSKWVNANTDTIGDIAVNLQTGTKNVALDIKAGAILNVDVNASAGIEQSKLDMSDALTRATSVGITQAEKGIVAFSDTQFTLTDGWAELQVSSSSSTGVTVDRIQYIGDGTLLGNRSGSAAHPYEITPAEVVTDGDGIKNASFIGTVPGTDGRVMIITGITPPTYSTTNITVDGASSSVVKTDTSGGIDVKQVKVDGYKTLDTSGTTLEAFTPGTVKFLSATGTTTSNTTITTVGTLNVNAITSASTTTFSPANAAVTLAPTGTGSVTISPASVGNIDNMNIGNTTRGTAKFTSLETNSTTKFTATTNATSTTTGAVQIDGGLSVDKDIWCGANLYVGNGSGALQDVSGDYGSVQVDGGATGGWEGFSIGGRAVFMHNNDTTTGLYNDVNNEWILKAIHNAGTELYYNGVKKIETTNAGATVTGTLTATLSGNATTATTLQTARTINGVSFNGSGNIVVEPYISNDDTGDTNCPVVFTANSTAGYKRLYEDSSFYFDNTNNLLYTTATAARFADLAEKYLADADYDEGTVVVFGGDEEVTITNTKGDHRVAGIISMNPSYTMNTYLEGDHVATVGLTGRLPCKVVGKVQKGDLLVTAAKPGYAIVNNDPKVGTIIGKALESKEDLGEGTIEVVVGRF